jgi:hypothetical protein
MEVIQQNVVEMKKRQGRMETGIRYNLENVALNDFFSHNNSNSYYNNIIIYAYHISVSGYVNSKGVQTIDQHEENNERIKWLKQRREKKEKLNIIIITITIKLYIESSI